MKRFAVGNKTVSSDGPCFVIAEIGHNHQGSIEKAKELICSAAECGADVAKFQKRDNKALYTRNFYNSPYENENSFGQTYGEHRDFLEFGFESYVELKKCAEEHHIEFMATAFDMESVEFLEKVGVNSYKTSSADLTNTPLLIEIAKLGKPMFVSTGAATIEEVSVAYESILRYNEKICLLHCTAGYPTDYKDLNLRAVQTMKEKFPDAIIGYSGHDNGILAAVIAYMLGATVVEKHFTLNRAWKGTDHKFSLEPTGLRKQVRDLRRVDVSLGDGKKTLRDFEISARHKMGKSLYTSGFLSRGSVLSRESIVVKSPGGGIPPYRLSEILGKRISVDLEQETLIDWKHFE